MICEMEADGIIRGYSALIDWDKTEKESVTAFIELKVSPQADRGFERIAERIYNYPEVRDMHLMSGSFDFLLLLEGRNLKEVALFVAEKLSPIEGVLSTSTHFILRKYKDKGVIYGPAMPDERGNCL
jgi:DNA-binding Lrp family transcriptional regulator